MSGGFFRGTSAEQDTRFSNKQAKLLKTQKFAPELEHLVDVAKVKMDVIKPWIARRVTELLGFEDEVLINFIYGLLEGKEINGKQVQIQLTGFMEKNTGKFMKELWALLLSAQKNASGVPQQFLDAKEEETRKKKAETDRIFDEIQRRKEKEAKESAHVKDGKLDGGLDHEESDRKAERGSDRRSGDENGGGMTNGFRGRKRSSRSPYSSDRSPSPHRSARSRSIGKSYSNSRGYSKERSVSRSISGSPRARRQSLSPERVRSGSPRERKRSASPGRLQSPQRSISPRRRSSRRSISPRHRSHSGRRSSSRTRYRSPSPMRRRVRSPIRRRSPSPVRRRSPSPVLRRSPSPLRRRSRSPLRRRSPSPWRRRSPPRRRRSPSPWRRRSPSPRRRRSPSPVYRRRRRSTSSSRSRSPIQRRALSPVRRRFESPVHRSQYPVRRKSPSDDSRSLSPVGRRSRSPVRRRSLSPVRRRSPVPASRRSPSPLASRSHSPASRSSASPIRSNSLSPVKRRSPMRQKSPLGFPKERARNHEPDEPAKMARKQPISLSPQRDHPERKHSRRKVPSAAPSPDKSPSHVEPRETRTRSIAEDRSPYESPRKRAGDRRTLGGIQSPVKSREQRAHHGSPERNAERLQNCREDEENNYKSTERGSVRPSGSKSKDSPDMSVTRRRLDGTDSRQKDNDMKSEEVPVKEARAPKKSPHKGPLSDETPDTLHPGDGPKSDKKRNSHTKDVRDDGRSGALVDSRKKVERRSPDSGSEGSEKLRDRIEKRKHRRSSRREATSDDSSSDSEVEDRKEAKRRRKEEKKLRREERRRRREERRRRREEKHSSKRKRKSKDADASSSEMEKNVKDANASNAEQGKRKYSSEDEESESQKKRLEIELREKALESLRAKKGISPEMDSWGFPEIIFDCNSVLNMLLNILIDTMRIFRLDVVENLWGPTFEHKAGEVFSFPSMQSLRRRCKCLYHTGDEYDPSELHNFDLFSYSLFLLFYYVGSLRGLLALDSVLYNFAWCYKLLDGSS